MRKIGIAAFGALMIMALALPGPAGASATGASVFNCAVILPVWPTPNGPPVDCKGKITGVIEGKTTNNKQFVIAPTNNAFNAHANKYKEVCTANEALNGSADGTITATGVKSVSPAGKANISGINFVWTRIGATAIVNLSGGSIYFTQNGWTATGKKGTALAAFAPSKIGTCTAPATNMKATIVGVTVFQS